MRRYTVTDLRSAAARVLRLDARTDVPEGVKITAAREMAVVANLASGLTYVQLLRVARAVERGATFGL